MTRTAFCCSHPVSSAMPHWPEDPPTVFTPWSDMNTDGFFLRSFCMGEHSGTHVNAPAAFFQGGHGIDSVASAPLVFPLAVIDVHQQAAQDVCYLLQPEDVLDWEQRHGPLQAGTFVAVHTGWDAFWHSPDRFLGRCAGGGMRFPAVSRAAARLLVQQRGIAGLGIDTHGIDAPDDANYTCNRMILSAGGIVAECLCSLGALPATGATVVLGVIALQGGTGAPAAVTVLVDA
ncbi:cyclase family protein [Oleidesulfovibrio alaskensis G20]|jgi:kynurenine formamidase|uniref:Cyclase family protein n=1 Tax=Oleidesulfovibrio alaskensis (strain ATCC BAA-1058 / DSM 17464 / G20) TaxID=207559 RepID=Q311D5_OLEA2|nr:cyclase family protein [Oleidesulfovibrio alaskensis]ABB38461.1 cyclase family protein [Oleidesulfovibrio alaskensis G20]MBG0773643.1 cyclase family protein [Oleidesulfovibrio alaskensis]MBL3583275.1 cyclase family protein [Oleidesulfovibrio alaskensis]